MKTSLNLLALPVLMVLLQLLPHHRYCQAVCNWDTFRSKLDLDRWSGSFVIISFESTCVHTWHILPAFVAGSRALCGSSPTLYRRSLCLIPPWFFTNNDIWILCCILAQIVERVFDSKKGHSQKLESNFAELLWKATSTMSKWGCFFDFVAAATATACKTV